VGSCRLGVSLGDMERRLHVGKESNSEDCDLGKVTRCPSGMLEEKTILRMAVNA